MCLAAPGRIVALESTDAIVDLGGRRRRASLAFRPAVELGDWVLVAAGSVVRRIDEREAHELRDLMDAATAETPMVSSSHGQPAPSKPGGIR